MRISPIAVAGGLAIAQSALAQNPTLRWTGGSMSSSDFVAARDTTTAHSGRASIRVHANDDPDAIFTVNLSLPAQSYVGHQIRFSAFLRAAALRGTGALWARADAGTRQSIAYANSQATAVRGTTDWTRVTLTLEVPQAATLVHIGVYSTGAGTLWIDDVRLESDGGPAPLEFGFESATDFVAPAGPRVVAVREPPRALTPRGLDNLKAFTTALGLIRFFHPSDQAVRVNWDAFAVRGVRAVESAPTADSLAATLLALFAPIAPAVAFARTGLPLPTAVPKPADATHVVFWRHEGVGVPTGSASAAPMRQGIYWSERITVPISEISAPVPLASGFPMTMVVSRPRTPDPARSLVVTLDGGVTASVPVALYTASAIVPDSLRTPRAPAANERFNGSDRGTRLADVALAWSLFQHFYPYFDVVRADWPAALTAALRSAATDANADAFQATLERLIAALHDGHGRVNRAMNASVAPDVTFAWADGRVFVSAIGDSAAAHGVRRGDELLLVDGQNPERLLADASTRISGATQQWVRYRALGMLLAGESGTPVAIRLRGADGATRDVKLTRLPLTPRITGKPDKIADMGLGVMYVDLGRINDADFNAALPKLQAAQGVIFDMRGYPSSVNTAAIFAHLTDSVIHSARFEVPIVTLPNRAEVGYFDGAWTIAPVAPRLKARIVFLSGGGAISYAESTLGVVEAYHLGEIVGEPSAGTNGNVNPFVLPGGYSVSWTGMLVQKRDGTPHHGVGVVPTVPVSPTVAGLRAGRDEVLERATAVIQARPVP